VRDEILRHLHGGAAVHLDLGDVTFMDSSGLHVLLATTRRASLVGAELQLVRVSPRVQRLLELTGTETVVQRAAEVGSPGITSQAADQPYDRRLSQS
jgi:anti-sigma B factor antagonist